MNKKLIIAATGLLIAVTPAWGFKANLLGLGTGGLAVKPVHEPITKEALEGIVIHFADGRSAKLNKGIIERISALASFNDEYGIDDGTLHFDSSRLEESAGSIHTNITFAAYLYKEYPTDMIKGAGYQWDPAFYLAIAQAMHTTQDFFAHATWVETNAHYKAFDKNKNLNPLSATKLPYPEFGKTANPFGEDFRAGTGVIILDDNPNNTNNDDKEGGCSEKSYNAGVGQLTTAYYDYAMSSLLLHAEVDKGYSTSAWNGIKISKLRSEVPPIPKYEVGPEKIDWPKNRCVHGGDKGSGINKDLEGRDLYEEARKSAVEASRNLMLEFLRVSGISDEQCGGILDCEFSNTKPSVTNIKLSYLSPYIQNGVQEHKSVWSFSASNGLKSSMLGVNFKGLDCDMMPDKSEFVCPDRPSYTGEGKLRIFQKVNPEVALYEVDNFTANPKIIIEQYASSNLTGVVKICNNCNSLISHGLMKSYEINWGDRSIETFEMNAQDVIHKHTYSSDGDVAVTVTFTDKFGNKFSESKTINISKSVMAINGGTKQILDKPVEFSLTKFFSDAASVLWQFFTSLGEDVISFAKGLTDKATWTFDKVGDYKAVAKIRSSEGVLETVEQNFSVRGEKASIEKTFNNPNLEREYDVQNIGLDTSDGTLRLPLNVGEVDTTFPYIWIANSGDGTISKLATRDHYRKNPQTGEQELVKTGQELGRYYTGPGNGNPSRTTVDQEGNVWVGNRDNNTITKVGLFEFGNCIDRNRNGVIDTSTGKDDIKDWSGYFGDGQGAVNAQDECILQHVALQSDGVTTPIDIRMIAIDKDNNVFAGGHQTSSIFKVNGATGQIIKAANTNGSFYGGLVDKDGNLWSTSRYFHGYNQSRILKVSNDLSSSEVIDVAGLNVYGIALDKYGKIWVTAVNTRDFATFHPSDVSGTLRKFSQQNRGNASCYAQGMAVDDNDNVFIAGAYSGCNNHSVVGHYKQVVNGNDTAIQFVANYTVSSGPTGVAVDGKGNVWSSDYGNNAVSRIILAADPANAKIDTFPVGTTPYNYSDMTGRTVRNITNRQGTWEAIFDGATLGFEWKKLVWSLQQALPEGTTVTASVKAADSKVELGEQNYAEVQSNQTMKYMNGDLIKGRFIKVKFQLTSANQTSTPEITGIDLQ